MKCPRWQLPRDRQRCRQDLCSLSKVSSFQTSVFFRTSQAPSPALLGAHRSLSPGALSPCFMHSQVAVCLELHRVLQSMSRWQSLLIGTDFTLGRGPKTQFTTYSLVNRGYPGPR